MSAFAAWWSSPVTAVLSAVVLLLLVGLAGTGFVAVVRLGAIQLGGLLAQRPRLLPGYPRRSDAYASLIVFLQVGDGVLLALFSLAAIRAGRMFGASHATLLAVLFFGWLLAVAVGLALARGSWVEPLAVAMLVALHPWTPVLRRLARIGATPMTRRRSTSTRFRPSSERGRKQGSSRKRTPSWWLRSSTSRTLWHVRS